MKYFHTIRYRKRLLLGLLALCLSGCGRSAYSGAAKGEFPLVDRPVRPDKVHSFTKLFEANCQGCHGKNGKNGPAPPLNDPLFLAIIPDAELARVIGEGRANTMMSAFAKSKGGALTDEQVRILIKGMRDEWDQGSAKDVPDYLIDGRGSANAGAGVFAMSCAVCHGHEGQGLAKHAGPLNDPSFLGLISDQALRRIVITGRPDLGMPDFKTRKDGRHAPLTNQDVSDVVAYLAVWRNR